MLMLCPNCHSDDVITVQDQLICVNCGRLLTATEAAAQKKKAATIPKVTVTKKTRPGRPRAAKLDAPIVKTPNRVAKPIADIKAPAPKTPKVVAEKRISRLSYNSILVSGLRALRPTWVAMALPGASLIVAATAYATSSYLYTPRSEQARELIVALAVFMSGFVWLRFIRSAVMFQRAGVHDHRLSGFGVALRSTAARSGDLALLYIRHTAALLAELSVLALIVWYGGQLNVLPAAVHFTLLFLACFAMIYLLAGLWVVQRLIEAGIVVSGLSLTAAHWLGWRLWRKHWELLGVRVAALAIIVAILSGTVVGFDMARTGVDFIIWIGSIVALGSLGVAMMVVLSGGSAEASYRQLVTINQPQRASRLLGKRHALRPSVGATVILVCAIVLPLAAALAAGTLWH